MFFMFRIASRCFQICYHDRKKFLIKKNVSKITNGMCSKCVILRIRQCKIEMLGIFQMFIKIEIIIQLLLLLLLNNKCMI